MVENMYKWNREEIKKFIYPTDKIRACGRTTLLVELYCEIAEENPGVEIFIQDHSRYIANAPYIALHCMINSLLEEVTKRNVILKEEGLSPMRFIVDTKKQSIVFKVNYQ
jgi:hypothetical protein